MDAVITPQTTQAPVLNPSLHLQARILAIFFLGFSLITSFLLYRSFGNTDIQKNVYSMMGLLLCTSTALMLPMAYTLWANQHGSLGTIAFILYLCLFSIEVNTTLGFTADAQNDVKLNSGAAEIIKQQAVIADEKLTNLAQYQSLDPLELQQQKKKISEKITQLNEKLAACPVGWITKCERPKEKIISSLEKKLTAINADLKAANQYQAALTNKETALNRAANSSVTIKQFHPLFTTLSKIFNIEPSELESNFLGFSALIVTTLTSLLFLLSSVLKNRFVMIPTNETHNRPSLSEQGSPRMGLSELLRNRVENFLTVKKT